MDHKKLQILVPQYKETEDVIKYLLDSIECQFCIDMKDIGVIICSDGGNYILDRKFLDNAANEIISDIISTQSTDVSAVSGATYSSRGIIDAVEEAIGDQLAASASQSTEAATEASSGSRSKKNRVEKTTESDSQSGDQSGEKTTEGSEDNSFSNGNSGSNSNSDGKYADGTYTGSGSGFRGTTSVSVKVEGGVITDITVTSYQDDRQFFTRAESGVISEILSAQSINVSTVSGATFSSNSIIEAEK